MLTILKNSYPTKMSCECTTCPMLQCLNGAYIKFEIDGEAEWLCAQCLKHHNGLRAWIDSKVSEFILENVKAVK